MKTAQRMEKIQFSGIRKIFEEANRREKRGDTVIHLEIGRPDFETPDNITAAAKQALDEGKIHYTSNYGIPDLRCAIAEKLAHDNGLSYDPADEVVVTIGVTEGIFLAMMALLNPGDEVIIVTPAFLCYTYCAHMAGAVPVSIPLSAEDDFLPDVERIRSGITPRTRMICINTPNNPTGAVYPEAVLEGIAQLARDHDLSIISDEIYEKIIYDDLRHISIAGLPGMKERTVVLNGFSKCYSMTGWRLGYAAASREIMSAMLRIHQYSTVCATSFAQWGGVEALRGPQDSVKTMVGEFDRRRRMIVERLAQMPRISFVTPRGAFYIMIDITQLHKSPPEIADYLLDEAGIAVVPWGTDHIRISYANSYENLVLAMDGMDRALRKLH